MKCTLSVGLTMQERTWTWARVLVCVAAIAGGTFARAQAVISPVVIEFGPKQKVATVRVTVTEKARGPMRLQAQLLRWHQDLHGAPVTQPSDDLVIAPRIAAVNPGQQQVFRLAVHGALPADTEMAYRLVLEDIAQPTPTDIGGAAVNFRMVYDLPVLVAPRGPAVPELRWHECPAQGAARPKPLCVRIVNGGNVHVKVRSLLLSGDGWQKSLNLKGPESILVGDEREWSQAGQLQGPLRRVQVRTAAGQVIEASADAR